MATLSLKPAAGAADTPAARTKEESVILKVAFLADDSTGKSKKSKTLKFSPYKALDFIRAFLAGSFLYSKNNSNSSLLKLIKLHLLKNLPTQPSYLFIFYSPAYLLNIVGVLYMCNLFANQRAAGGFLYWSRARALTYFIFIVRNEKQQKPCRDLLRGPPYPLIESAGGKGDARGDPQVEEGERLGEADPPAGRL